MSRYEIVFKGHVQGVGFRFTARDLARESGLPGWVRNLPNGSVQMEVEGAELFIQDLVAKLERQFSVADRKMVSLPECGDLADFEIRY